MNDRITVILPPDLIKDIDSLKEKKKIDQSTLIRQLLYQSIKEEKIKMAIDAYKNEKISFGIAADLAGLSLWEFIDEIHRTHVGLQFNLSEAEAELLQIEQGKFKSFIP